MPRRTTQEEDQALLRARGTLPEARATASRFGDHRKLAFLPLPVEMALQNFGRVGEITRPRPAPWVGPSLPLPLATDPRSQRDRRATYSAAFRPEFFPPGEAGFRSGHNRAIELRDYARTIYQAEKAWRTAVILVEFHYNSRRYLVAGINGSFNEEQHHMLDALKVHDRFDLRDKKKPGGPPPVHPDIAITTGVIGGLKGTSAVIGSSIRFCPICKPQIAGAGFWLIPDGSSYEAHAPTQQAHGVA